MEEYVKIATLLVCLYGCSGQETVITKSGAVRGVKHKERGVYIYTFLGIPYAEPPVREMRFKDSIPVKPWEGIYDATKPPPSCMQDPPYPVYEWQAVNRLSLSEDCLYLNIWAPVTADSTEQKAVMVWIYGGGWFIGSSNQDVYEGKALAARGDVVVVTLNYRLGAFGFLYSGTEDAPGNMGMKDQILAFRWIKDNIEAFGGDPSRITLFGQSTGSMSISMHLVSPLTKGLFSRAILQSGTAYQPALTSDAATTSRRSSNLAMALGCIQANISITMYPSQVVSCMRSIDSFEVASADRKYLGQRPWAAYNPLYGDEYLPLNPIRAYNAGIIHDVEVLTGSTTDEGSIFLELIDQRLSKIDHPVISKQQGAEYIESLFQGIDMPPTNVIINRYLGNVPPGDSRLILKRTYDSYGDWLLYCPVIFLSEVLSMHGMSVYTYVFSHRRRVVLYRDWLGVPHFEDVPFTFDTYLSIGGTYSPIDQEFSNTIMDTWSSFAKTGKPIYGVLGGNWPQYSKEEPVAVVLNPDYVKLVNPYKEGCRFWRQYY